MSYWGARWRMWALSSYVWGKQLDFWDNRIEQRKSLLDTEKGKLRSGNPLMSCLLRSTFLVLKYFTLKCDGSSTCFMLLLIKHSVLCVFLFRKELARICQKEAKLSLVCAMMCHESFFPFALRKQEGIWTQLGAEAWVACSASGSRLKLGMEFLHICMHNYTGLR